MSNQMKLLISAFMVLLLGVILIRPIADDIAKVSDSSISINNETLSFITLTTAICDTHRYPFGGVSIYIEYLKTYVSCCTAIIPH